MTKQQLEKLIKEKDQMIEKHAKSFRELRIKYIILKKGFISTDNRYDSISTVIEDAFYYLEEKNKKDWLICKGYILNGELAEQFSYEKARIEQAKALVMKLYEESLKTPAEEKEANQ